jgi:hypothetical protein
LHDYALFTDVTQPQWLGHVTSADHVHLGSVVEFGPNHVIFTSHNALPRALDLHDLRIRAASASARTCSSAPRDIAETTHYQIMGDLLSSDHPKAAGSGGVDVSWGTPKSKR